MTHRAESLTSLPTGVSHGVAERARVNEEEHDNADRRRTAREAGGGDGSRRALRSEEHTAEVVAGEDGKVCYRQTDGREFKSLSAAASAVMGGQAANGWRFWNVQTDAPPKAKKGDRSRKTAPASETDVRDGPEATSAE